MRIADNRDEKAGMENPAARNRSDNDTITGRNDKGENS
jgi:hypothetical protein